MLADYHIHTSYSDDSNYPMKNCIERAISLGFDEICFTEHIDYGCPTSFCCDCNVYLQGFLECKKIYENKKPATIQPTVTMTNSKRPE